jgi:hypothetical protein
MTHEDRIRILESYGTLYVHGEPEAAIILVSTGGGTWKSNGLTAEHATRKMYEYIQKFILKQIP